MKKFFEKYSYIGCLLPFIIGGLFPVVMMFVGIWKACNGNIGYFIINILSIPFALLGLINIIRGFCSVVLDNDSEKFQKYWQFALYLIANIIGYIAIGLAIVQWLKFQ
jgi:hypothetical protein